MYKVKGYMLNFHSIKFETPTLSIQRNRVYFHLAFLDKEMIRVLVHEFVYTIKCSLNVGFKRLEMIEILVQL